MPSKIQHTKAKPNTPKTKLQYGNNLRRGPFYARKNGAWVFGSGKDVPHHLRGKRCSRRDSAQDKQRKAKSKTSSSYAQRGDSKRRGHHSKKRGYL